MSDLVDRCLQRKERHSTYPSRSQLPLPWNQRDFSIQGQREVTRPYTTLDSRTHEVLLIAVGGGLVQIEPRSRWQSGDFSADLAGTEEKDS